MGYIIEDPEAAEKDGAQVKDRAKGLICMHHDEKNDMT